MPSPPRSPRGECAAFDFDELDELQAGELPSTSPSSACSEAGEGDASGQLQPSATASSWPDLPALSREDWIELLDTLGEKYRSEEVQEALHRHWRESEGNPVEFLRRRQELLLPIQAPVMAKFGFEPSVRGVMLCGSAFDSDPYRLFHDPEIFPKRAAVQWLADPDLQLEQPEGPSADRFIDSYETQRKKAMNFVVAQQQQGDDEQAIPEGPPPPTEEELIAEAARCGELWRVVGGVGKGGILVREGQSTDSPESQEGRLAVGAFVRALEVQGERLCYWKLSGEGPASGWVSTKVGFKDLVIKVDEGGHSKADDAGQGTGLAFDERRWPAPCPGGGLRLGELLWAGSAGLRLMPPCDFFPRRAYAAHVVVGAGGSGSCASLLLLGGARGAACFNDVWQLSLPRLAATDAGEWSLVSPHKEAEVDSQGRRVLNKWRARQEMGSCTASLDEHRPLVYVAGGCDEALSLMNDVWVSADRGSTWACKCRSAPWERRAAPALASVPGRPQILLLAGGMARFAEVCGDVWTSDDAGETWTELESPAWSAKMGRYRSALFPLSMRGGHECRLLLLGGCHPGHWAASDSWAGDESLLARECSGLSSLEKLLHDAWECQLDLFPVERAKAARWTPWGLPVGVDSERHISARWGVIGPTCAFDAESRSLIASFGKRLSAACACCPKGDLIDWHEVGVSGKLDSVVHRSKEAGMQQLCVRLVDAACAGIPRVLVVGSGGVLVSGDEELARHWRFASLLGVRLAGSLGLPYELWSGRVLPFLLVQGPSPERAGSSELPYVPRRRSADRR